ncbi:MAG: HNH endonuclease [Nitrospinae bacterium]|nr:HNH endonuclease [Nitrospinota bacterium]
MVQNEYEYIEFLVQSGLQENSAYSYGRYLEAISTHLNIVIGFSTITSDEDVASIIENLSETDLAQNYKNNCGTALRAYLRFVGESEPAYKSPDEIVNPDKYTEGAKKKITVNSYERDNSARNKCIEIHGLNCAVCKMSFKETYGSIGIGFIHVHHIKPLSEINENYVVNPETDLMPVCPNCHAMLHRPKEAISIESLREVYDEKASNN